MTKKKVDYNAVKISDRELEQVIIVMRLALENIRPANQVQKDSLDTCLRFYQELRDLRAHKPLAKSWDVIESFHL